MRVILLIFLLFKSAHAYAQCDFVTASHIDGLSSPESIKSIFIEIPNSANYARHVFKILSVKSTNIPNKLKKKFKAKIIVNYDFGSCKYSGRIRQSGDGRDHIKLLNGNPIQSLDVKLNTGNIFGATRFKLLIPETRNGRNEILGSLLLRALDFITPETFEVQVSVNGTQSVMLFQEKATKELLERNLRREGPIFEGDESILWSYQNYYNFELLPLALSRLVNDNWFNKGNTSQKIILDSFIRLQTAYLKYAHSLYLGEYYPNLKLSEHHDHSFNDYHLIVLAMNGWHSLSPNNRQFYFNAIENRFEPVYYDGNLEFKSISEQSENNANILSSVSLSPNIRKKLDRILSTNELKTSFLRRVYDVDTAEAFYYESVEQLLSNLKIMQKQWRIMRHATPNDNQEVNDYTWYLNFQKHKNLPQNIYQRVVLSKESAILRMIDNSELNTSLTDLSKILSEVEYNGERFVLLPDSSASDKPEPYSTIKTGSYEIRMSVDVEAIVDTENKKLIFNQVAPSDWVLIRGGNFSDWSIRFNGVATNEPQLTSQQRFNEFGLTGCLTLYETKIDNSRIEVSNGLCEDSLNLVRVSGLNLEILITNSFADALDADFSNLNITNLYVEVAGNDCFDVSGGSYQTIKAELRKCRDKAISVGEMSSLQAATVHIDSATIGVSAKDLSKVSIQSLNIRDASICGEAKQKKQEFGGGFLTINKTTCDALLDNDPVSVISVDSK